MISIGDKNDSYNFINAAQEIIDSESVYDYIVRGNWDRTIQLDNEDETKLLSHLQQQDVIAKLFILPERNGVKARQVQQEVRAASVKIKPTGKDADVKAVGLEPYSTETTPHLELNNSMAFAN